MITRIFKFWKNLDKINVFLDIDNTLAIFSHGKEDDSRAVKESLSKGFYLSLKPMPHLWAYKLLSKFVNVYVVSAYPNTPYAAIEKRLWVDLHMPFINQSDILLVPVGGNKAEAVETRLGRKIDRFCYLVDDYGKNLTDWTEKGGTAIKKSANTKKKRNIPVIYNHYDIFKVLYKSTI